MTSTMANVTRAALGRAAEIGALYDIRTDRFLNDTLFTSDCENNETDTMYLGDSAVELVMSDSIQEKCSGLDVEGELQVSVIAGMVKLAGSGAYLADEKQSARAQRMSCIYKQKTVNEEFMIRQNRAKVDINILAKNTRDASHVVVGIDWGAICTITCEYENVENEDAAEVKEKLNAEMTKLKCLLDNKESTKLSGETRDTYDSSKFTFKCKVDVSAPNKALPVDFDGAVEMARTLPELLTQTYGGKGVPLTYYMMPLCTIAKMCNSETKLESQYTNIDDDTIKKCTNVLTTSTLKRQNVYDLYHDINTNGGFVPDRCISNIDTVWEEISVQHAHLRSELQELVRSVRSGSNDASVLEKFLRENETGVSSTSKYKDLIDECQRAMNEVVKIKSWRRKGILYLGKNSKLLVHKENTVFVLFKPYNPKKLDDCDKQEQFFMRLHAVHGKDDHCAFFVVDQGLAKQYWPAELKITIHKYVDGSLTCRDVYTKEGQNMDMCMIAIGVAEHNATLPISRTHVKLRCPNALSGTGRCTGDPVKWRCSTCKEFIEYGISTKLFHCKCGKSKPIDAMFRCNDINHDMGVVEYPEDILETELSQHFAMNEMNILIMGETGVGKSTWINGFQQFLYFESMNEAMHSQEFPMLIPSTFTIFEEGNERLVEIGEPSDNEEQVTGQSATKFPQAYVFCIGDTRIRLIDTPGIGASEGILQDKQNVDNILSYISNYDEIHAVCILLKPNSSRLTTVFRFCIQELLAQLHSSAKDNIVFCFTHTRETFYQPGETLPVLNKELREKRVGILAEPHNYFCFDGESFRFLACIRNNIQFSQTCIEAFAVSWDKSVFETGRLFRHIKDDLEPYKVRDTLSMHEARRTILVMSKPLADVTKTIEHNLCEAETAKKKIDANKSQREGLEKDLMFAGYDLTYDQLTYPRTVCKHPECVTSIPVGKTKVQNTVYNQVCHDHCTFRGVPTKQTGRFKLRFCKCINLINGTCKECSHHASFHMHITCETRIVQTKFLSEEVRSKIQAIDDVRARQEAFETEIRTKIAALEDEQARILEIGAKYASFLTTTALIPYNDAVGDYLDMCIKEEEDRPIEARNTHILQRMKDMKREYIDHKDKLDEAIGMGVTDTILTPVQVQHLQNELFKLKYFGQTLQRLYDDISLINSSTYTGFSETRGFVREGNNWSQNENESSMSGKRKWFKPWTWRRNGSEL